MPDSTLAAIRKKVRRLTGSPNISQLTNADLDEYVNVFYEQDLPSHLKLWNLYDTWTFFTTPNEDRYDFPKNDFHAIKQPIYIDGYQSFYTQSREEFFRIYPKVLFEQNASTGTGIAGPYAFTLSNIPVLKRDVTIYAEDAAGNTQTVEDDGNGNLVDAGTTTIRGTIDYVTGAVSVTFAVAIPATSSIIAKYFPYQASRPDAFLFFYDYITLRPVPDAVYRITAEVFIKPSQLLANNPTAIPDIEQWWQLIALGAARKVLQDRLDNESLLSIEPFFNEQMNLVMYRTATQLASQRVATIYTEQLQYPVGGRGFQAFS